MDLEQEEKLILFYCRNEMLELKRICDPIIVKKGIPQMYHDDLYSDALKVLEESIVSYDESKSTFKTYLIGNIKRSFYDWTRDSMRGKRCNVQRDENGKILKDENGKNIVIHDVSFDTPIEDGVDLSEKVASVRTLEDDIFSDTNGISTEGRTERFLSNLGNMQRRILELLMNGYSVKEVKQELGITSGEYNRFMEEIRINENLSMFTRNVNDGNYETEGNTMSEMVMEIGVSDSHKTTPTNLFTLLEEKKNGDINCKYILQRKPYQWTNEEVNRYIARILSGLPIPEIIICEQKVNNKPQPINHLIDGLQRSSYAESYKENRIKIGEKGAERHLIQYRKFKTDDKGNRILDKDGNAEYDVEVFDIVGKKYKDLPDDLKKRFNMFSVNVTKFFDCTDQQIADHIRDYNNHAGMNKEQGGFTKIDTDIAEKIKNISENNKFFKNCGKYTKTNRIKGKLDRVVAEALMLMFYRDKWISNLDGIYHYINDNATDEEFDTLDSELDRLERAIGNNNKNFEENFVVSKTPMWLAVFHEFTTFGMEDSYFLDFLVAYNKELKNKEINGVNMGSFSKGQTKGKATITGKIELLTELMIEYLCVNDRKESA